MRAAQPLQLSVRRYGLWRAIVLAFGVSACASMTAWWLAQPAPAAWVGASAGLGLLAALAGAGTTWWQPPLALRWDGRRWQLARNDAAERPGEVAVAIDFGGWMLLRFVADAMPTGARRRSVWVALQRRGLEAEWHALRCALYARRPARLGSGDL